MKLFEQKENGIFKVISEEMNEKKEAILRDYSDNIQEIASSIRFGQKLSKEIPEKNNSYLEAIDPLEKIIKMASKALAVIKKESVGARHIRIADDCAVDDPTCFSEREKRQGYKQLYWIGPSGRKEVRNRVWYVVEEIRILELVMSTAQRMLNFCKNVRDNLEDMVPVITHGTATYIRNLENNKEQLYNIEDFMGDNRPDLNNYTKPYERNFTHVDHRNRESLYKRFNSDLEYLKGIIDDSISPVEEYLVGE